MRTILTLALLALLGSAYAQTEETIKVKKAEEESPIFTTVEEMPEFPGGHEGLLTYLGGIEYPAIAKDSSITGRVFTRFVIDTDGTVTDVEVVRGADPILNEATVQHISNMPNWTPGKQRGKPVKVQYIVPMTFKLD